MNLEIKEKQGVPRAGLPHPIPSTVLVADDLTGACDAAVHFAEAGLATSVSLRMAENPLPASECWALNTDSRSRSRREAAARVKQAFESVAPLRPRIALKKIDSMMRGNVAAEIATAREVLRPQVTLFAVAFPAMGRTVQHGSVHVCGERDAISIAGCLAGSRCACLATGTVEELSSRIRRAIESKNDILVFDALTEDDMRCIVEAAAPIENVLWVGSGGLAKAIAQTWISPPQARLDRAPAPAAATAKPLLLCAGSDHAVTAAQLRLLEAQDLALFVDADAAGYAAANRALQQGRDVVLRLSREQWQVEGLKKFSASIETGRCGGLILTGGDTALQVLDALGAKGIRLRKEILPGIPQGEILGGAADGLLIATKSGAFGGSDALDCCIRALRAPAESFRNSSREKS